MSRSRSSSTNSRNSDGNKTKTKSNKNEHEPGYEDEDGKTGSLPLVESFLQLLLEPETNLLALLLSQQKETAENNAIDKRRLLVQVCRQLFAQVQSYHDIIQRNVVQATTEETTAAATTGLGGLTSLYVGEQDDDDDAVMDAETVWGQIDLQNEALRTLLKKNVKQLTSSFHSENAKLQLLDLTQVMSDRDDGSDKDGDESESQSNSDDEEEEEDDEPSVDEETKQIRARMARTMADMDNEEDDDDDNEERGEELEDQTPVSKHDQDDTTLIDPVREEMMDGFFDLHEMEAFADEEEEYLPDEAYGEEEPEEDKPIVKKKSFHQRQRDGDVSDDDDGDDENDVLVKRQALVRRKKYRPQEEADVLIELYETPNQDDEDDDDEVINMTAADFFGKPNKKAMERYQSKKQSQQSDHKDDDDADSWDNHDFDDTVGWNDDKKKKDDGYDDDGSERDQSDDDENPVGGEDQGHVSKGKHSKGGDGSKPKAPTAKDKLLERTLALEQEMLAEKPWHMVGESKGTSRPLNSLLELTPNFETATKAAPMITVEHTQTIEEIIKKRILDEDWDNVIPRELPDVGWNQKRGELPEVSQEKSKLGLGELYEREYLKKAVGYDKDAVEKETEEEKAKSEMKALFASLCSKLDALSNYHFAPRPISEEADIRPISTPAIAMEEVLPLHVSDARGVAPEQVYGAKQGRDSVLRGDSELTQDERKRLRNAKKAARRKARKRKADDEKLITKLQPSGVGLSNPYEKRKIREELQLATSRGRLIQQAKADDNADYGASSQYFSRLQHEKDRDDVDIERKKRQRMEGPKHKSSTYKL